MKYFLTIIFATAIVTSALSQSESGLYLTVQCARKSERHLVAISNKSVCLASSPIVLVSEFQSITQVESQLDKVWFDITMSDKALQMLTQISDNLPKSTFALLIDKNVFSTFEAQNLLIGRTFRFQGTEKNRSSFTEAQRKLKALIESAAK